MNGGYKTRATRMYWSPIFPLQKCWQEIPPPITQTTGSGRIGSTLKMTRFPRSVDDFRFLAMLVPAPDGTSISAPQFLEMLCGKLPRTRPSYAASTYLSGCLSNVCLHPAQQK